MKRVCCEVACFELLDCDSLQHLLLHVKCVKDHSSLVKTCRLFRRVSTQEGFAPLTHLIRTHFSVNVDGAIASLLFSHFQTALKLHAMMMACDVFIREFERTKCAYVNGRHMPFKLDLAGAVCQEVNDFRVCGRDWLVGRMMTKLVQDGMHDTKTHDLSHIVLYSLHTIYQWRKSDHFHVQLAERCKWDASQSAKHMAFKDQLDTLMSENVKHSWIPVLDSDSVVFFTSLDVEQIQQLIRVMHQFIASFKWHMNKSSIYHYRLYRRDMRYAKSRIDLMQIKVSLHHEPNTEQ
jgi:hypothetical protein